MAGHTPPVSVIIPLRDGDQTDSRLMAELEKYGVEIIVSSEGSRAKSLNNGAMKAKRKYLWFLHADSVMGRQTFKDLQRSLENHPARLHYFDLIFTDGGLPMMKLNALGANFRSRILGIPFGDQGLCIRKDIFLNLEDSRKTPLMEKIIFSSGRRDVIKSHCIPSALRSAPVHAPIYRAAGLA